MNVKISCNLTFPAGIWWDDSLIMNTYNLRIHMITVASDPANQNIALDRVKYMIDTVFTDVVFVNQSEQTQIELLTAAGIPTAVLPEDPVDQVIGMMLHSKLNAVMEGQMIIRVLELSSSAGDDITYEHAMHEENTLFETPGWWNTVEPECSDSKENSTDLVLIPPGQIWRELNLVWQKQPSAADKENVVVFAEFRNDQEK